MRLQLEVYASELALTEDDVSANINAKWKLYDQKGVLIGHLKRSIDRSFLICLTSAADPNQIVPFNTADLKVLDYTP